MKKQILSYASALLLAGAVIFTGCGKDDEDATAPVVTLKGAETIEMDLGEDFSTIDPGATASDDEDGSITNITVTGIPDGKTVGTFTVKYSAKDKAGNEGSKTRTVKVKSDKLAGTYSAVDVVTGVGAGSYDYTATVTQSSTEYNKILIKNFGSYDEAVTVYAIVEGDNITIPDQKPAGMPTADTEISGSGTYDGATFKIKTITYSAKYPNGETDNGTSTYTKQ